MLDTAPKLAGRSEFRRARLSRPSRRSSRPSHRRRSYTSIAPASLIYDARPHSGRLCRHNHRLTYLPLETPRAIINEILDALDDAARARAFDHLPERIILLRHGESEANIDPSILGHKPDNMVELTERGREQARAAGLRIKKLLGPAADGDSPVATVVLSPFERTQQTLCCLLETLGETAVREVHVDSRVREQEFGNLQNLQEMEEDRALAPRLAASTTVATTASRLLMCTIARRTCGSLCSGYSIGTRFAPRDQQAITSEDKTLIIVTHGLTMRLLLMKLFSWSVDTFECVFNPSNCDMWVLRKNYQQRIYELAPKECHPPRVPWAVRRVLLQPSAYRAASMPAR